MWMGLPLGWGVAENGRSGSAGRGVAPTAERPSWRDRSSKASLRKPRPMDDPFVIYPFVKNHVVMRMRYVPRYGALPQALTSEPANLANRYIGADEFADYCRSYETLLMSRHCSPRKLLKQDAWVFSNPVSSTRVVHYLLADSLAGFAVPDAA